MLQLSMVKQGLAWVVHAKDQKGGKSMRVWPLFTEFNMARSYCKYRNTFCCSLLMFLASLTDKHFWNVLWKLYHRQNKKKWHQPGLWLTTFSMSPGTKTIGRMPVSSVILWVSSAGIQCPCLDFSLCWSCVTLSGLESGYLTNLQG